ncbi:MAG TPA: hypothetical protein VKQ28_06430 [Candidatus Acidoferrum sp.]|nr:hypothetical protein [Candidatus Acidoferrum sp.]
MRVREAKDFLVQETAKQASMEGVPLSELEKRMMYFTENGEMAEDPIALNEEFEAQYNTDEYEAKISGLLHRAYARIKKENPEAARLWKEAIRGISKGDHYLPVLWGERSLGKGSLNERPPHDFLKLVGASLLVVITGGALMLAASLIADRYGLHWPNGKPNTQMVQPVWLQRLLIFILVASYIYGVLPLIFKKTILGISELWSKVFGIGNKGNPQR